MLFARQSTDYIVRFGPLLTVNGSALVTGETPFADGGTVSITLSKNGGVFGVVSVDVESGTWLNHGNGIYGIKLLAATLDVTGYYDCLIVSGTNSFRPILISFCVLPPNVYDSLLAGTDTLAVTQVAATPTIKLSGPQAVTKPYTGEIELSYLVEAFDASGAPTPLNVGGAKLFDPSNPLDTVAELDFSLASADVPPLHFELTDDTNDNSGIITLTIGSGETFAGLNLQAWLLYATSKYVYDTLHIQLNAASGGTTIDELTEQRG